MTIKRTTVLCALTALMALTALPTVGKIREKTPAFPGAEGYARYVTGGRGGKVYRVTNLDDSGNGSLRWALSQSGKKTIVFSVSGTIHLKSELRITDNTTIAGQTAPGDGICIADFPCSIKGSNVIVRYMRFRLGNKSITPEKAASGDYDGWDGFGAMDQQDIIIDHCSVSWSIDECFSVLGNKNTTVQWCMVAQSMVKGHSKLSHGYGGNWGGDHASFHHNLIVHHSSRTPRLGPRTTTQLREYMDMRNNVIYNWGNNGCYGGEAMKVNIVNNYYKPGPGTPTNNNKDKRIASIGIRTTKYVTDNPSYKPAWHIWGKYFVEGNVNTKHNVVTNDNWTYGIYNQITNSDNDNTFTVVTRDTMKITEPLDITATTTHTAEVAYERVLAYVGASKSRDSFDELMVSDTRNGVATNTGSGLSKGFINTQDDNKPADAGDDWSAWPELTQGTPVTDADGDGMDDAWETANGLNPNDANDGSQLNDEGYTMLEVYLNSLVSDITEGQNAGGELVGSIETEEVSDDPTYVLSAETSANNSWTFSNGFSITTTKSYATAKPNYIKYSKGQTYTINIPAGITITKVDFSGYSNVDNETAYLSKVGNQTFTATDYVYPSRTSGETKAYTVTLSQPATGTLPFVFNGQQVCMVITLYAGDAATIKGDLNGDGYVDVGDIMTIINYMANPTATVPDGSPSASTPSPYNLNGDGYVDVGDIMTIINIMAGA